MTELHLFAGAGGGILGGLLLGHTPVCAVEIDPYCQEVLRARQRDGFLPEFPIHGDITTFDGTPWAGRVDIVAGGFPCQDISVAGKGVGIEGARSGLWNHMARVIGEVRPRYAFVENSPALVGRGLAVVLGDLAALGYDARWTVLGAHHVGAPHKRDRIWILAESIGARVGYHGGAPGNEERGAAGKPVAALRQRDGAAGSDRIDATGPGAADVADASSDPGKPGARRPVGEGDGVAGSGSASWEVMADAKDNGVGQWEQFTSGGEGAGYVANRYGPRLEVRQGIGRDDGAQQPSAVRGGGAHAGFCRWPTEPRLGRVAHGVANRVDRLRAIGNGQVPRVAAAAWRELMSWEVPA